MPDLNLETNLLKVRVAILAASDSGTKEYDAAWLKDGKTVTRDGSGRFASKGGGGSNKTQEDIKTPPPSFLRQGINKIRDLFKKTDPEKKEAVKKVVLDRKTKRVFEQTKKQVPQQSREVFEEAINKMAQEFQNEDFDDAVKSSEKIIDDFIKKAEENATDDLSDDYAALGAFLAFSVIAGTMADTALYEGDTTKADAFLDGMDEIFTKMEEDYNIVFDVAFY